MLFVQITVMGLRDVVPVEILAEAWVQDRRLFTERWEFVGVGNGICMRKRRLCVLLMAVTQ